MTDSGFVRALFILIAFLLVTGVIGYGLATHNWWLIIGNVAGAIGGAISSAVKKTP